MAVIHETWILAVIGSDVAFEYRPLATDEEAPPFPVFLEKAANLIGTLLDDVETKALRMGSVREGLLPEMDVAAMDALARRLLTFPKSFDAVPWEWDWRCATSMNRKFGTFHEPINRVATIKRAAGKVTHTGAPFDRVRVDFDFSTSATNKDPRMNGSDAAAFLRSSAEWHAAMEQEIDGLLGVGGSL